MWHPPGQYKPSQGEECIRAALCSAWVPVEVLRFCTHLCVFNEAEGHDALKQALEELAECADLSMCIDGLVLCGVIDQACEEDMLHCLGWCPAGACNECLEQW